MHQAYAIAFLLVLCDWFEFQSLLSHVFVACFAVCRHLMRPDKALPLCWKYKLDVWLVGRKPDMPSARLVMPPSAQIKCCNHHNIWFLFSSIFIQSDYAGMRCVYLIASRSPPSHDPKLLSFFRICPLPGTHFYDFGLPFGVTFASLGPLLEHFGYFV